MRRRKARRIVGVIFSRRDLARAAKMKPPPDLFELRLDALGELSEAVKAASEQLPAPIIITARHPAEGGANRLSSRQRRELLLQFLPLAAYVDVELRSATLLRDVLGAARIAKVKTIISFHDLRSTPSLARLDKIASAAKSLGADIIKVATRTDSVSQMDRLLRFFEQQQGGPKVVAMGIGKLGKACRRELFRRGCALNYAPLGKPQVPGQLTIAELHRLE